MLLAGGFGLAISALTVLGMSGAGESDAGVASGLFNTTQQVGGALGVAVLSTLVAAHRRPARRRAERRAGATGGFHLGFGLGAVLLAVSFILTAVLLRQPKPAGTIATAEPVPDALVP